MASAARSCSVAFAVITGLDAAAAEAFPGPRLFDRRAEIAGDGQRRSVVLLRLAASRAPEPQFTQGVQHGRLDEPDAERTGYLQGLPKAVRGGGVVPGQHVQRAQLAEHVGLVDPVTQVTGQAQGLPEAVRRGGVVPGQPVHDTDLAQAGPHG